MTAIARNPEKITAGPAVTAKKGDVFDKAGLVSASQEAMTRS